MTTTPGTPSSHWLNGFSEHRNALTIYSILAVVQAWIGWQIPLVPDEAYYLAWSEVPSTGYFDHPPLVALVLNLTNASPRIVAFSACHMGLWLLADAGRCMGIVNWRWIPSALLATPLGMAWGVLWTPDGPLVFGWCLLVWCLVRRSSIGVGLALGFGLWSKATMLPAIPGVIWALGLRSGARAVLVALIVYAPHVIWSIQHDGCPGPTKRSVIGLVFGPENVLAQMALAGPLITWIGLSRLWNNRLDEGCRRSRSPRNADALILVPPWPRDTSRGQLADPTLAGSHCAYGG